MWWAQGILVRSQGVGILAAGGLVDLLLVLLGGLVGGGMVWIAWVESWSLWSVLLE